MLLNGIDINSKPLIHKVNWPVQNVVAFTTTKHTQATPNLTFQNTTNFPFNFFNVGDHVGDVPENVINNRQKLLTLLPVNTNIQWLNQIHGSDVATVNTYKKNVIVADAVITQTKHLALSIMTADCLPILLSTLSGDEIAAIHGGWRPLLNNIIDNTINNMKTTSEIIAWLGPCIGPQKFEVGQEVKDNFINQSISYLPAFIPLESQKKQCKYLMDLRFIAKIQLKVLGVTKVYNLEHCTFSSPEQYYSYRRDGQTGRMTSIICRQ